jgi:hypothetical protein
MFSKHHSHTMAANIGPAAQIQSRADSRHGVAVRCGNTRKQSVDADRRLESRKNKLTISERELTIRHAGNYLACRACRAARFAMPGLVVEKEVWLKLA